ncbi:hypothetical protein [Candidatus Endomicrobiellum agilis]|uniref:hypothetical protein n=1 Tax=Candidatus Endomicrobiellum agilis TaxID=3238957 RepID=UPI00358391E9|nr:hypothetical protein [Endomicrobium sp.]
MTQPRYTAKVSVADTEGCITTKQAVKLIIGIYLNKLYTTQALHEPINWFVYNLHTRKLQGSFAVRLFGSSVPVSKGTLQLPIKYILSIY